LLLIRSLVVAVVINVHFPLFYIYVGYCIPAFSCAFTTRVTGDTIAGAAGTVPAVLVTIVAVLGGAAPTLATTFGTSLGGGVFGGRTFGMTLTGEAFGDAVDLGRLGLANVGDVGTCLTAARPSIANRCLLALSIA